MSLSTPVPRPPRRQGFRDWRRSRPFWGGVTAILAGIELYALTAVPFSLMVIQGIAGISALLIMVIFITLAVVTWFQPQLRLVTGLIIVILALASILLTNLGGFLIGMLLGIHSGASIAAWKPQEPQESGGSSPMGNRTASERPAGNRPASERPVSDRLVSDRPATAPHPDRHPDAPPGDAQAASAQRRARRTGNVQGIGIVLAVLALVMAPTPRASAATAGPARAAQPSLFCQILPFLCSPAPTPSPAPAPNGTTTPAPAPSKPAGGPAPSLP
ncbi:MAG TPA: DUF6114 domain-containing protein, partial [Kineosporiaceae bacterium]|nr:DUF6114 domain-containing protein [Kineosporiaceae bacterium]